LQNFDPIRLLSKLVISNHSNRTNELFSVDVLYYKKIDIEGEEGKEYWEYTRVDIENKRIPPGYGGKILLDNKNNIILNLEKDMLDNEIALYYSRSDYIVTFNEKYIGVLRLIKNGYNPDREFVKTNKNLLPAIILALGLIISSIIYAFANRYELIDSGFAVVDKWTSTIYKVHSGD